MGKERTVIIILAFILVLTFGVQQVYSTFTTIDTPVSPPFTGYKLEKAAVINYGNDTNPAFFDITVYSQYRPLLETNILCGQSVDAKYDQETGISDEDSTLLINSIEKNSRVKFGIKGFSIDLGGVKTKTETRIGTSTIHSLKSITGIVQHVDNENGDYQKKLNLYQIDQIYRFTPVGYTPELLDKMKTIEDLKSLQSFMDTNPGKLHGSGKTQSLFVHPDVANRINAGFAPYPWKVPCPLVPFPIGGIPIMMNQCSIWPTQKKTVEFGLQWQEQQLGKIFKKTRDDMKELQQQLQEKQDKHPMTDTLGATPDGSWDIAGKSVNIQAMTAYIKDAACQTNTNYSQEIESKPTFVSGYSTNPYGVDIIPIQNADDSNDVVVKNTAHQVSIELKVIPSDSDIAQTFSLVIIADIEADGDIQPHGWSTDFANYGDSISVDDLPEWIKNQLPEEFEIVDEYPYWRLLAYVQPPQQGNQLHVKIIGHTGLFPTLQIIDEHNYVVPGATVEFEGHTVITDVFGGAHFDELTITKDGIYEVSISKDGYESSSRTISLDSEIDDSSRSNVTYDIDENGNLVPQDTVAFEEFMETFDFSSVTAQPSSQITQPSSDLICVDKVFIENNKGRIACVTPSTAEKLVERGWGTILE